MAELGAENRENRKLVGDAIEVHVDAEVGTERLPDFPVRVLCFGSFRTDAREALFFCKAQVSEESISGLR